MAVMRYPKANTDIVLGIIVERACWQELRLNLSVDLSEKKRKSGLVSEHSGRFDAPPMKDVQDIGS
jgi:hypothetical protein